MLAITRGGLVPAGMLAYRLDLREILVAGAVFYRPEGGTRVRISFDTAKLATLGAGHARAEGEDEQQEDEEA